MRARIIHTKFFTSERVLSLSAKSRWLFMYFLTCSGIGHTGAFKWSNSVTCFETGLSSSDLSKAKTELENAGLVFFLDQWVIVPDTEDKTGYDKGPTTSKAYQRELDSLPETVKDVLISKSIYPMDRVSQGIYTPINHKEEIINNKTRGESAERGESAAQTYSSISDLGEEEFQSVADQYGVPVSFVKSKYDDMANWLEAKGKRYKNYLSALRNWVKKDALELKKGNRGNVAFYPGAR